MVKRLLLTYQDLTGTELEQLVPTDLYTHRVRLKEGTIFTDHHPLTYFLNSSCLDGIYARWASELRYLNIEIVWIPGSRNSIADALSRTIFPSEKGTLSEYTEFGDLVAENWDPRWIWKDGTNGYEELLKTIGVPLREKDLRALFLGDTVEKRVESGLASLNVRISELGETVSAHVAFGFLNSLSEISTGLYKSSWESAGAEAMGGEYVSRLLRYGQPDAIHHASVS
ncbi:hypothetical protein K3495_g13508 [Podosphaera aphanis]|nr:hypothetical protein K3495_g13508 [Podosphaera aphanis]